MQDRVKPTHMKSVDSNKSVEETKFSEQCICFTLFSNFLFESRNHEKQKPNLLKVNL